MDQARSGCTLKGGPDRVCAPAHPPDRKPAACVRWQTVAAAIDTHHGICGARPLQPAGGGRSQGRLPVFYSIAVVLLVLWLLGMITSFTAGGLLHLLLVVALIIVVIQFISGRRVG